MLADCSEKLSYAYLALHNIEEADRYSVVCHEVAMERHDWNLSARAELLRFSFYQYQSEFFKGYISFFHRRLRILKPLLERTGMINSLAYVLSNETMITAMLKANQGIDQTIGYIHQAMELAEQSGNTYRLALAHHGLGIYYQAVSRQNEAETHYRRAIELARSLNGNTLVNRLSNGIGYFFFSTGDYLSASEYYNLALEGLSRSRDFEELCSTFFNFASVNFFLFRYRKAMEFYELMLKVMNPLGIVNLRYHSREIICSLIGICALKAGDINKAYKYYYMASEQIQAEDIYSTYEYFTLLKAFLSLNENRRDDAIDLFDNVLRIQSGKEVDESYLNFLVLFEKGLLFQRYGMNDRTVEILDNLLLLIPDGNFPFLRTRMLALRDGRELPVAEPVVPENFSPELITELAVQEADVRLLEHRMEETRLLNELQSLFQSYPQRVISPGTEEEFLATMCRAFICASAKSDGVEDAEKKTQEADRLFREGRAILNGHPEFAASFAPSLSYLYHLFLTKAGNHEIRARELLKQAREEALRFNNYDLLSRFIEPAEEGNIIQNHFALADSLLLLARMLNTNRELHQSLLEMLPLLDDRPDYFRGILQIALSYHSLVAQTLQLIMERFSFEVAAIALYSAGELIFSDALYPVSRHNPDFLHPLMECLDSLESIAYNGRLKGSHLEYLKDSTGIHSAIKISAGDPEGRSITLLLGNFNFDTPIDPDIERPLHIALGQLIITLENIHGEGRLLRQNLELEKRVAERTVELEESLKKIDEQRREIQLYSQQLEQLVDQRSSELVESEKMAGLGQLVTNLAHEVNNPLGNVTMLSGSLESGVEEIQGLMEKDELGRQQLEKFLSGSLDMLKLQQENINRVMDLLNSYRKLSFSQAVVELEAFDICEFLQTVFTLFRPRLKKTSIRLEHSCAGELTIRSYPGIISQILTNLLINALTHAFAPGDAGVIRIDIAYREGRLQLSCVDDGQGMDDGILSRIFEPFFTTNKTGGGTGLGLHIIHNLVTQNLSGEIDCRSAPGKGTEFIISFPAERVTD